jgi:dinuclear metal center YbgI/SA1388 family protein
VAARDEIVSFCDELLDVARFGDFGPNGLQVPGTTEVEKLVSGVSASRELLEASVQAGAQLALVHHGLFWEGAPQALSEQAAARLRVALEAELSLAAYHLPLDAHREIGNNALLCEGLGFAAEPTDFAVIEGQPIGIVGRSGEGLDPAELVRRVAELCGRDPLAFDSGPDRIHLIGIVSGGGSSELGAAVALGLDAFLTGEPREPAMAEAREGQIHYLAAGHHATETFGIRRLGELAAERFDIEHEFIDVPNPI